MERVRWTLRLTARIIAGDWSRLAATALPAIVRRQKRRLVETAAAKAAMQAQSTQTQAECARGVVPDRVEAEQKAAQPEQDLIKTEKISDQVLRAPVDGAVHATETQIDTSTSPNSRRNSDTSWSGKRLDLWIAGVRAGNETKF